MLQNSYPYIERAIGNWLDNLPQPTHEEYLANLPKLKIIIDKTPDKWLQFHFDNAVKDEQFELAAYVRDTAQERNIKLKLN